MMFAVEEINRDGVILPGVTLGYRIHDTCDGYPWALQASLSLSTGDVGTCRLSSSELHVASIKPGAQSVAVLIGPASSTSSRMVSSILSPLSVPIISYLATCPCLSDRSKYPNFFRTIPSDVYQFGAFARLAVHFQWTWIGAVVVNNDYGLLALQVFQEEIKGKGVCLEFIQSIRKDYSDADTRRAAITIQAATARVILIIAGFRYAKLIFMELDKRNVTGRQFLASESWSTNYNVQDGAITRVARGVIGVAIRSANIPGFDRYLQSLNPICRPEDDFLRGFWEKEFGCSLSSPKSTRLCEHLSNMSASFPDKPSAARAPLPLCSGDESLEGLRHIFTDTSQLRRSYNVYVAVYAAAHALRGLLACQDASTAKNSSATCSPSKHINPAELLQQLTKVRVGKLHGDVLQFQGADIPAKYDLVNWQITSKGSLKLAVIGLVDGLDLYLNETDIQWSTGSSQVPTSVCSESCPPGTRVATKKGRPVCCFDCIPCAEGEISNTNEFWSNAGHSACVPRQIDFLSFNETLGATLTAVAVSGTVVTTAVFVVFLFYKHTPVVRANNAELSFLLLVSLKLCFLCSLVFIGRPSVWSCRFQQAAFGISFVLCLSCLLVKTVVVLVAFRSGHSSSKHLMKWFGPCQQRGSVCLFTCIQVTICAVWLSLSPPLPGHEVGHQGSKLTLKCDMASVVGFSLVLGYIGLLACTCLLLAFLARKLPDNFNEAKLITFSMLIFCAVWVAFVPAYISSPGKYTVAVEIFAILASSYGLLLCIFAPKCFIIILRPQKNTKKNLLTR
ncbi:extracellular calcium-sensing receptor-like [Corythoichthys intestinalis]|uniref:extracellular calcium-sensing receptor-like n=1 Tax=Corythoichthys intestinalis TaxID=161448 RepID=UPI0025A4F856|nr:extracellular calcium-sensing receptor-like [Corythoichthys intestinalis]